MTLTDLRKSVLESTPVLAVVGATDLAVERLRAAVGNAAEVQGKIQESLEPGRLAAAAQQVPALAVAKALEVAGKAEAGYAEVARRGGTLVRRVSSQRATQDLLAQGRTTLSRTRAAATARGSTGATARRTATPARGTATTASKRAATRTRTKAATTSARQTAQKAATAAKVTADKVGD